MHVESALLHQTSPLQETIECFGCCIGAPVCDGIFFLQLHQSSARRISLPHRTIANASRLFQLNSFVKLLCIGTNQRKELERNTESVSVLCFRRIARRTEGSFWPFVEARCRCPWPSLQKQRLSCSTTHCQNRKHSSIGQFLRFCCHPETK